MFWKKKISKTAKMQMLSLKLGSAEGGVGARAP